MAFQGIMLFAFDNAHLIHGLVQYLRHEPVKVICATERLGGTGNK